MSRPARSPELPDAIGWRRGCESILVECETSPADFLAEARKVTHQAGGYLGRQRYHLLSRPFIAEGLELPVGWGLLVVPMHAVRQHCRETLGPLPDR